MRNLLFLVLETAVTLAAAPLATGMIRKAKARFQNRAGASVFQPYWAIAALMKKRMTVTKHASWVFRAVPFAALGSSVALAVLLPAFAVWGTAGDSANFFAVAAVMMIGAIALVLGGMDVASAFGGMGSSREMTLAAILEPAAIVIFAAVGIASRSWTASGAIVSLAEFPWPLVHPFLVLVLAALALLTLAEAARYPVDNPATHLELTMVHEAMILEYSGPYLAMLEYASSIKFVALAMLFMNLLFPASVLGAGAGPLVGIIAFAAKLAAACLGVAFIESAVAKMRFYRMQEFAASVWLLAFLGLALNLIF